MCEFLREITILAIGIILILAFAYFVGVIAEKFGISK